MWKIGASRKPRKVTRTRTAAAAILAFMLGTSAASLAFASSLQLSPPSRPTVQDASRCSSAEAVVTLKGGSAEVAVPEGCRGQSISLFLGSGQATQSVPVGTGSGTVTVPQDFQSPESVLVTSDTWPLLTTWIEEETPGPEAGLVTCTIPNGTCEITNLKITEWGWPELDHYTFEGTVTSTSTTAQPWTVTINLSDPYFSFVANGLRSNDGGGTTLVGNSGCSVTPRTVTVKGRADWSTDKTGGGLKPVFNVWGELKPAGGAGAWPLLYCP